MAPKAPKREGRVAQMGPLEGSKGQERHPWGQRMGQIFSKILRLYFSNENGSFIGTGPHETL